MKLNNNDRTSRGYCGWYKNNKNVKVYLRSKLEFIVAKWLDILNKNYKTESIIYNINGKGYKPDFFIYNNYNIKYIIEVKYSKKEAFEYINKYYNYFKNINIKYIVLYKRHTNKLINKYCLKYDVEEWINKSSLIQHDMKGCKNPHFGFKHSNKTKKFIGFKTSERMKDPEFKKIHSKAIKRSFTNDRRKVLSDFQKNRMKDPKIREWLSDINRLYNKKLITNTCLECNKKFDIYGLYDRINGNFICYSSIKHNNKLKGDFCSISCSIKYRMKKLVSNKRKQQSLLYIKFKKLYKRIPNRKEFKQYCKDNGIMCDIRSTFGTYKKLKGELLNG